MKSRVEILEDAIALAPVLGAARDVSNFVEMQLPDGRVRNVMDDELVGLVRSGYLTRETASDVVCGVCYDGAVMVAQALAGQYPGGYGYRPGECAYIDSHDSTSWLVRLETEGTPVLVERLEILLERERALS